MLETYQDTLVDNGNYDPELFLRQNITNERSASMEQAIFTTLCMVYDNQNRVLVQERHGTAWDGIAFPGGHVGQGESFVESVKREVYEETSYHIQKPVLCGIKQFQETAGPGM